MATKIVSTGDVCYGVSMVSFVACQPRVTAAKPSLRAPGFPTPRTRTRRGEAGGCLDWETPLDVASS
ncbi:unnamed protein product [Arctogadus glacialis]